MSVKKDTLFKEIDIINENVRFWHNLLIVLLSGLGTLPYLFSQKKIIINWLLLTIVILGILGILAIIILIKYNHKKREKLLHQFERTKQCKRYSSWG